MPTLSRHERLSNALTGRPVDRPPVWIMRQAGRYLPEYRATKSRHTFLELCHRPELAAEVTLQPLRRFPTLDAGIIFSDILVIPEAMGIAVDYPNGGPTLEPLVRSVAAADSLPVAPESVFQATGDAIGLVIEGTGREVPIYGFAGAPFTLATYMIEGHVGGKQRGDTIRRILAEEPEIWNALVPKVTESVINLLRVQARGGASVLQLFDTWAGLLSPAVYAEFVLPGLQTIVAALKPLGLPLVYFANGIGGIAPLVAPLGFDALGCDWRVTLSSVRKAVGPDITLQGNIDPTLLHAPADRIARAVRECVAETGGHRHILNLGTGIHPEAPIVGVEALFAEVERLSA